MRVDSGWLQVMISDCKILIRYIYQAYPLEDFKGYEKEFSSFPDFVNYLIWEPERAALVGFSELPEETMKNSRNSNVSLAVKFNEGSDKTNEIFFRTFQGMTTFFKERPDVAEKLQYKGEIP
jgi:hypothetical protein